MSELTPCGGHIKRKGRKEKDELDGTELMKNGRFVGCGEPELTF